jgi:membrane protein
MRKRCADANGDLLPAGVGYFAFFSVLAALALASAVFGFVLQGRPDLLEGIADYLNGILAGMVRAPENPDGIIGLEAPQTSTLAMTGIVSVVALFLPGLGWVGALRKDIRGALGSSPRRATR